MYVQNNLHNLGRPISLAINTLQLRWGKQPTHNGNGPTASVEHTIQIRWVFPKINIRADQVYQMDGIIVRVYS